MLTDPENSGWGLVVIVAVVLWWVFYKMQRAKRQIEDFHPLVNIENQEYRVDFAVVQVPESPGTASGRKRKALKATVTARTATGWRLVGEAIDPFDRGSRTLPVSMSQLEDWHIDKALMDQIAETAVHRALVDPQAKRRW